MSRKERKLNINLGYMLGGLIAVTFLSGLVLSSSTVSADDSVVDEINITVPVSCTMSGTGMNSHNANITNGTYQANIGTTTLHTFCNDNNGFAIYAAGYTGNEIGETNSNKLVGTTSSNNAVIDTGLATAPGNPDISNWAMKLAITQDSGDTTGTNALTIDSAPNTTGGADASFTQYHVVPNEYTKVAHKNSVTDMTTTTGGVKLTTTYAAYISKTQPADTYTGQVIYTLVHPSDHAKPIANPAILDTGKTVNAKLKSLAATVVNGEETTITPEFDPDSDYDWEYGYDEYIKTITVHTKTSAPTGFIPSEKNTISTSDSKKPIYAVFDNTNDAGIMHFYTEGEQVFLSPDSSFMFYFINSFSGVTGISDWDTSNVTNMSQMFRSAGSSAATFTLDLSSWDTSNVTDMSYMFSSAGSSAATFTLDLSSWDTSNVTDMSYMFSSAGYSAITWSIGNLSSWDTSSVTDMSFMFEAAGYSATTFTLDLSSWNTASVTDMRTMFYNAGYSATTWSIGNLSSWDTSSVTDMSFMFEGAGYSATTFSLDLSSWNTSSVTSMYQMFFDTGNDASSFVLDLSDWDLSSAPNVVSMFSSAGHDATTFTLDLSDWDTSSVTDMGSMFSSAGYSATTFTLDLSSWNTSSVTYMRDMFNYAGYSATTFTLDLSDWDTSSVTDMAWMFSYAGYSATTFTLDLSSWNTASVTNMSYMFRSAGYSATAFTLNLSSWNTSSVTNMNYMFRDAGYSATTWSVTIPKTNDGTTTGPITNTTSRLYGKTSSTYIAPLSGKSFTLVQP